MARPKIALIGGGQVGGNIALLSAQKELGDIVIIDIPQAENFIKGKALDISQLLPHDGYDVKLSGSSDFSEINDNEFSSNLIFLSLQIFDKSLVIDSISTFLKS